MVIYYIHFPFLTCEVKYNTIRLNITDRQNAYSMTVIIKNIIKLFRGVEREQKLYRQILDFLYFYDHESLRI
jgi:hypothetical protein